MLYVKNGRKGTLFYEFFHKKVRDEAFGCRGKGRNSDFFSFSRSKTVTLYKILRQKSRFLVIFHVKNTIFFEIHEKSAHFRPSEGRYGIFQLRAAHFR